LAVECKIRFLEIAYGFPSSSWGLPIGEEWSFFSKTIPDINKRFFGLCSLKMVCISRKCVLNLLKNEAQIGRRPIKENVNFLKNEPQIGRSPIKENLMFLFEFFKK
jgi:hypothetical protein